MVVMRPPESPGAEGFVPPAGEPASRQAVSSLPGLFAIVYVSPLADVLKLQPIAGVAWLSALAVSLFSTLWAEALKLRRPVTRQEEKARAV